MFKLLISLLSTVVALTALLLFPMIRIIFIVSMALIVLGVVVSQQDKEG